jgi:Tfp pilus assembly PilM family ATPase
MAQKFVSIYVTHDEIKMCVIEKTRNSEVVSMAFSVPTPQGCVDDGFIRDANQVGYAINNELSARRIDKVRLYFTIFSKKIAAKEVELPYNKSDKLMADMISANIGEYFPMGNLDSYISRHTVLETFDQGGGKQSMVAVYVIPKDLIAGYYELARVLRLPLESIDYQVNSLLSVVKRQNRRGNTLFIQVDNDATHITVMKEQSQIFRRSVNYGSNNLVQAMATSQNLTEKEADEILKSKMMLDRRMNKDEYREFMRDFCASISRVVDFFGSRHPEINLEGGRIFGSGIGIANIDSVLGEALGLDMEIVEHLVGVNIRNMKAIPGVNQLLFVTLTNAELAHYLPNIGVIP